MIWHNFRTGGHDIIKGMPKDDVLTDYLPQIPAALNMYEIYVEDLGKTPQDAFIIVLEKCCGVENE